MSKLDFHQEHLDRVSRSFAFCIARLEGDMKQWVGLSYLLCRILDTVEDSPWHDGEAQEKSFSTFEKFICQLPTFEEVQAWAQVVPATDPGEKLLLQDAYRCFLELHSLPQNVREKIQRPVLDMFRGMKYFLNIQRDKSVLRLHSLHEVNQYCFFVAGLVGDLLNDLVSLNASGFFVSQRVRVDAHHFGLFLQKINLLKDQAKDEKEGRFLVPSRAELLGSLRKDAEGAIRYLLALPMAEKGFRLFCAWSLFLGLASLPFIEQSALRGLFQKIPRFVTEQLLGKVERLIDDNQALMNLFAEMLPSLPASPAEFSKQPLLWMRDLYSGSLGQADFAELGLT